MVYQVRRHICSKIETKTPAMAIPSTLMKSSPVCRTIQINGKQHYLWRAVIALIIALNTPYRDGTTQVAFEPVDFIARIPGEFEI